MKLWSAVVVLAVLAACTGPIEETDPVFKGSASANTGASDVAHWNEAYAWGDHSVAGYLKTEADPVFSASPASSITAEQLAQWSAMADAGYLQSEADPLFAASAVASVSSAQVGQWDEAFGWGDHSLAGYLTSETDPAFSASAASGITSAQVNSWDAAFGWGDHAAAGYLKAEVDPKIGALTKGQVPAFDGTKLAAGSISELSGRVGVSNTNPDAVLAVGSAAKIGRLVATQSKSCGIGGFDWTNWRDSVTACSNYCASFNIATSQVAIGGSKTCGGAFCDYISDFSTCAVAVKQNNGNCDSCTSSFSCNCLEPSNESVFAGKVGVNGATPTSELSVAGYIQVDRVAGTPPAADCDAANERGRMKLDPASNSLWVCANSGWVAK